MNLSWAVVLLLPAHVSSFAPSTLFTARFTTSHLRMQSTQPTEPPPMSRPLPDRLLAGSLLTLEKLRVRASSASGEGEDSWEGEPQEWAEKDSAANAVSVFMASGPMGKFKQWVADVVAGDYDKAVIAERVDGVIAADPIAMFSFTTCPFCLKSKQLLDDLGVSYTVLELDQDSEGNAVRAWLGEKTGRTSMPSVWIAGEFVGGCNDGPGLTTLQAEGKLMGMLSRAGALRAEKERPWWDKLMNRQ